MYMYKINSVLVVDDNAPVLAFVKDCISLMGTPCATASNGESALELIQRTPFDLLIADIKMNGMSGLELTEKAKKIRPRMAVILMTGFTEDFSFDSAIDIGASDFLKKPFTARELALRIRQVELQEELRCQSLTDELTGLYNRRGLFTMADHHFKMAKRQKHGFYMLYGDIDDLKKINDEFGHGEGDVVLIEMANILKANYREVDIIARLGGDEFALLPVAPSENSQETIISRLENKLKDLNASIDRKYRLSISLGVAYYDPNYPCTIDEMIARADKMMYEQKAKKGKGMT